MKKNYDKVFEVFRKNYKAPPLEAYGKDAYKTLISTLLSARTRDDTTLKVCEEKLFKNAPSIHKLSKLTTGEIETLIYPVSFYKTKAKHLKKLAEVVINKFGGKIPKTRDKLISLPGVGRKTANLILNRAFGIPAIAVDTHVHKITNMLGWVKTKTPQETERELMRVVPKKYWTDMNRLFVSIGQQYKTRNKQLDFLKKNNLVK